MEKTMQTEPIRAERDARFPQVEWRRSVPLKYQADVAVLGGGMAGVCAACAAAATGASVLLVERFAVTGGVLTTGGVGNFSGDTRGLGEVFDEILAQLGRFHAVSPIRDSAHNTKEQLFDHEILTLVLQEMLLRRGVKLLLHTRFADVRVEDGWIKEVILCGPSGPEALAAKVFIDCTGEAQVAYAAGFATMKGRNPDGKTLAMSMMAFVRHVFPGELNDVARRRSWQDAEKMIEYAAAQIPEGEFGRLDRQEDLPMVSVWPNGPCSNALKIKVAGYDSSDTESLTAAEIRGRRDVAWVLDYYQRVKREPWILDHVSPIIGIREGRRVVGDYVLTLDDVKAGRAFEDGVARGTWYLDAHSPDSNKRIYDNKGDWSVPPYQIPLRSLIARDGRNLLMAGRCLSADSLAHSSARVSPCGAMMGQAAGIAAALAATRDRAVRELDFGEVKAIILERGANLACGCGC
jgi:hypothetical protein